MDSGIKLIEAERERQQTEEGFTVEHDDQWQNEELALAALTYCVHAHATPGDPPPDEWPWDDEDWKPKGSVQTNLVHAGALYLAARDQARRRKNPRNAQVYQCFADAIGEEIDELHRP